MSSFFLYLPSNSSQSFFPNNTRANYITRLLNTIELNGTWEVALWEILFTKSWYNIKNNEGLTIKCRDCDKDSDTSDSFTGPTYQISISEGHYSSVQDVVSEINYKMTQYSQHLQESENKGADRIYVYSNMWPMFKFNEQNNKVVVGLPKNIQVTITDDLSRMLGFRRRQMPIKGAYSSEYSFIDGNRTADINDGLETIYIYSDIIEHIPVGHITAPLLRIVDSGSEKQGSLVRRNYNTPIYVPVQKKNFDSIEIDLRTDRGKPVPFERGTVLLTLHFRKSGGEYFN